MSATTLPSARTLQALALLLFCYGCYAGINGAISAIRFGLAGGVWPLTLTNLVLALANAAIAVAAGLALWRRDSLGWWLGGVYLGMRTLGSMLTLAGSLQLHADGSDYAQFSVAAYEPVLTIVVALILMALLATKATRHALHTTDISAIKTAAIWFGYGFLVLVFNIALLVLVGVMSQPA